MVSRVLEQRQSATRVAADFGVSERTVRKWLARWRAGGAPALNDRSSAPARQHRLPAAQVAAIEAERLELRDNQFIRNGQQVVPRLSFEPEVSATAATSAPGSEVRLQAREQSKDVEVATRFAELPEARLIKSDMAADRARIARSQQQRQASAWPGPQFAPLPEPVLVARPGR